MTLLAGIIQIGILYIFYLAGSKLTELLHLPIPGSITGMLLLLTALSLKLMKPNWIQHGAKFLNAILPLLLGPATIGVMNYPGLFSGKGLYIFFTVIASTAITIIVAGKISQYAEKITSKKKVEDECMKHLSH